MTTSAVGSVNHIPPPPQTTAKTRQIAADEAKADEVKKENSKPKENPQSNRAGGANEINITA